MSNSMDIPAFINESGQHLTWVDGFEITCSADHGAVCIKANEAGLRSPANLCLSLTRETARGAHIHLDEFNSLEPGSSGFIISKT